ncbi:hypothetical protein PUN28_016099 [Cardiocondyla obscurior]|uniref:Uncharacterized protein n=1 Tax=Cardiocondyla obscurior TaxID=286306 RepID=A0AAW2ESM5_9HYME
MSGPYENPFRVKNDPAHNASGIRSVTRTATMGWAGSRNETHIEAPIIRKNLSIFSISFFFLFFFFFTTVREAQLIFTNTNIRFTPTDSRTRPQDADTRTHTYAHTWYYE